MPSKVRVTIRDPDGKQHHADLTQERQEYAISKGGGGGGCRVCFKNYGQKGTSTRVEVSLAAYFVLCPVSDYPVGTTPLELSRLGLSRSGGTTSKSKER